MAAARRKKTKTIDLTQDDDSDCEICGPPVVDVTGPPPPPPRARLPAKFVVRLKRPRDTVRSKGVALDGPKRRKPAVSDAAKRRKAAAAAYDGGDYDAAGRLHVRRADVP